jgi:hypothetical protein
VTATDSLPVSVRARERRRSRAARIGAFALGAVVAAGAAWGRSSWPSAPRSSRSGPTRWALAARWPRPERLAVIPSGAVALTVVGIAAGLAIG